MSDPTVAQPLSFKNEDGVDLFAGTPLAAVCRGGTGCLCAAWAAAEASVPPGSEFNGVRRSGLGAKDTWVASYDDDGGWFNFYGPTPADALRALALRLREVSHGR